MRKKSFLRGLSPLCTSHSSLVLCFCSIHPCRLVHQWFRRKSRAYTDEVSVHIKSLNYFNFVFYLFSPLLYLCSIENRIQLVMRSSYITFYIRIKWFWLIAIRILFISIFKIYIPLVSCTRIVKADFFAVRQFRPRGPCIGIVFIPVLEKEG